MRFQTAQGQDVHFTSNISTSARPQVGAPIEVLYLPNNPEKAKLPGCRMWVGPITTIITGGFVVGVGVAVGMFMPG